MSSNARFRNLRLEELECREMLATLADVVFPVDESGSSAVMENNQPRAVHSLWLRELIDELSSEFSTSQIDARYGLVGYGETSELARSHLVNGSLFDTNVTNVKNAFNDLVTAGGREDGWDAIEHALAEYDFRNGAVPLFVLVQSGEGRVIQNDTLLRSGILSALKSSNVVLNTMVTGQDNQDPQLPSGRLVDLQAYGVSSNLRVLGVEADASDGSRDYQHDYYLFNTVTDQVVAPTFTTTSDAVQVSYNGSNTGATGMVASQRSVLISPFLSDGVGSNVPASVSQYRFKNVEYAIETLTSPTTITRPTASVQLRSTTPNFQSFTFKFFGQTYFDQAGEILYVTPEGLLSFNANNTSGNNADLSRSATPARPTNPIIAALWDDLKLPNEPQNAFIRWQVLGSGATQRLVIQWENFLFNDSLATFPNGITFQAVLFADGRIRLNYQDLEGATSSVLPEILDADNTGGISATVGIWSGAANQLTLPAGKIVPGPHSISGSRGYFNDVNFFRPDDADTNDSYVRMAWDTGGATWDAGIIREFFNAQATGAAAVNTPELNALRDAFISSLSKQILRRGTLGDVFRSDVAIQSINFGSGAVEGFTAGPSVPNSFNMTTTNVIDTASNSIPLVGTPPAKVQQVFRSARVANNGGNLNVSIGGLANGSYVVELFFAEIDSNVTQSLSRVFDVVMEGKTYLKEYSVWDDYTKIVTQQGQSELATERATQYTGTVKRFEVDVVGGNGLQIDLIKEQFSPFAPHLSGVRILRADPPRVEKVVVSSSLGSHEVYDVVSGSGKQIGAVPVGQPNRISVTFDQPVTVPQSALTLSGKYTGTNYGSGTSFVGINTTTRTATWTFNAFLLDQLELTLNATAITGGNGLQLDGEWFNATGVTNTTHNRDGQRISTFPSGNGTAGGNFVFYITSMRGNASRDNFNDQNDLDPVLLNWGGTGLYWDLGDTNGNRIVEQGDLDNVLLYWGTPDLREWPISGGSFMMSNEIAFHDPRASFVSSLDAAFERLGMEQLRDSLNLNVADVLSSEQAWQVFISDLVQSLDSYYGIKTA